MKNFQTNFLFLWFVCLLLSLVCPGRSHSPCSFYNWVCRCHTCLDLAKVVLNTFAQLHKGSCWNKTFQVFMVCLNLTGTYLKSWNPNWPIASFRLACGDVCGTFSWDFIDVEGCRPLGKISIKKGAEQVRRRIPVSSIPSWSVLVFVLSSYLDFPQWWTAQCKLK